MTDKEKELAIDIIRLIIQVGVPAAIKVIQQIQITNNPTPDEISALSDMLKQPEDYFNCGG
jgi:hypothetical protein